MSVNNRKYIITFLSLISSCLIISWLIILPTINKIKKNNAELTAEKQEISSLLRQGQNITENKRNLKKIMTQLDTLDNVWLKNGDELKFITDLEKIAAKNNLSQTIDFNNKQLKEQVKIKMIPVKITVNGNLIDIMHYINELENLNYYINFSQIDFTRQTKEIKDFANQIESAGQAGQKEKLDKKITLNVKLNGLTYWK